MKSPAPERAVVVGLGSIGKRHLRNLRELCPETEVAIWRHSRSNSDESGIPEGCPVFYDFADVARFAPQIAIVANPASHHVTVASPLAACGTHLFIEKPLAHSLAGLNELIGECERRHLVLMTGYTLRFNSSLRAFREAVLDGAIGRVLYLRAEVGSYLPDWRPDSDYQRAVSARAELGGGAVLELSHELDYARWICGELASVCACVDRLSDLQIEVEDTAEILVRFRSGVLGSIHLDMVQRSSVRKCHLVGSEGRLEWDGIAGGAWLQKPDGVRSELHPAGSVQPNEMYLAELSHFLECVARGTRPLVSGGDGRRVVEIVEAVKRSSSEKRWIDLS